MNNKCFFLVVQDCNDRIGELNWPLSSSTLHSSKLKPLKMGEGFPKASLCYTAKSHGRKKLELRALAGEMKWAWKYPKLFPQGHLIYKDHYIVFYISQLPCSRHKTPITHNLMVERFNLAHGFKGLVHGQLYPKQEHHIWKVWLNKAVHFMVAVKQSTGKECQSEINSKAHPQWPSSSNWPNSTFSYEHQWVNPLLSLLLMYSTFVIQVTSAGVSKSS